MHGGAASMGLPPDAPEFVELNGLLATPGAWRWATSTGVVTVSSERDLAAAWGLVAPEALLAAIALLPRGALLLAYGGTESVVHEVLPQWTLSRARQHVLDDVRLLQAVEIGAVSEIGDSELRAAELPDALLNELLIARRRGAVMAACADGRPVSFATAPWRTDRWYDISVDTLPEYRRQGHATRAFAALWRQLGERGLAPVWGAEASNCASLAMATQLGFVRAGEVLVFRQTG